MAQTSADSGAILAERVSAFTQKRLSPRAVSRAKALILDTVGVALAGTREPSVHTLLATPGIGSAPGEVLVFGTNVHTSALDAALVNGFAANALGFGGFVAAGAYHPAPLMAELFALGQDRKVAGEAVVRAYALGLDVLLRPGEGGEAVAPLVASAAAASHVIGLDPSRTLAALRIAAGFGGAEGGAASPLASGELARKGVAAALLAERGFEPPAAPAIASAALADGAPLAVEADDLRLLRTPRAATTIDATPEAPMGENDLWEKFEANVEHCLPRDRVAPLFETLDTLDKVKSMGLLARLLEAGTQSRPNTTNVVFAARGTHEPQETTWVP